MPRKKSEPEFTPEQEKLIEEIQVELKKHIDTCKVIEKIPKLAGFPAEFEEQYVNLKKQFAWTRTDVKIIQLIEKHLGLNLNEQAK